MSFKLKYVSAICLLSFSSLALAHNYKDEVRYKDAVPCPPPQVLMDGWYLGLQLGHDAYDVEHRIAGSLPLIGAATIPLSANPDISAPGFVGGLLLGYGQNFNQWYLGGEIFANSSNADSSWSLAFPVEYTSKFEVNGSYGIALLPGFKFTESTLTYIRLGYNWARFKYKETLPIAEISASRTKTEGGFNYGIGMETLLAGNWSLRGEYSHTNYGSFSTSSGVAPASNLSTKIEPHDNQFMLGLIYHI